MNPDRIALNLGADGVAHVRLNRPARMNAIDGPMFDALIDTSEHLRTLPQLRAVVLSGEGPAFCAGLDLGNFERILHEGGGVDLGVHGGGTTKPLSERTHGIANAAQQAVLGWRALPVPVVAVLHGVAFGGGFQLALGADLRFAAPDARLCLMELAWGLVPDMAGIVLLRDLVGADRLRELVYRAAELSSREALAIGVVSRVCADPLAEALAFAADVARKSPDAVRAAKRLLNAAGRATTAELLLAESREAGSLLGSENQLEAVRARREKRAPRFSDPR